MARRRSTPLVRDGDAAPAARAEPPAWAAGFLHYVAHRGVDPAAGVPVSLWSDWHRDKDAWCIKNGCHRPGTKTCTQATGRDCRAGEVRI